MRILIVEDETGIAELLKQGLEEESYKVDLAHEGDKGLKMAKTGDYDLLILDWMLPNKSGVELCKEFRIENKETPVIFLTAKDTVEETITGLHAGANDYVKKPFHFDELLVRIRVQLRTKTESSNVLLLGPILIDLDSRQVTINNEIVSLTQKEYELLKLLVENKNKVCDRSQILEAVWNIHFEYNSGVIDVFINSLRKKLKISGSNNLIRTVRGVGYIAKES